MTAATYDFKITPFLFMTFCFHFFLSAPSCYNPPTISWNNVTWNIRQRIRIMAHHTLFNMRGIFVQEDFSLRDWNIKEPRHRHRRSSEIKKGRLPCQTLTSRDGCDCRIFCKTAFSASVRKWRQRARELCRQSTSPWSSRLVHPFSVAVDTFSSEYDQN